MIQNLRVHIVPVGFQVKRTTIRKRVDKVYLITHCTHNRFDEFREVDVRSVHTGYFSKMKNMKLMEEDRDTFDLITKDKEKLLSFEEPIQFIFTHSALREGWDNPLDYTCLIIGFISA